jgi:hypothetical protein
MTGVDTISPRVRGSFVSGFPEHGIWTAVGLGRGQFFAILGVSLAVFAVLGGPVWTHVRDPHLLRITVSYAVIPLAVWVAMRRNGRPGFVAVSVASLVLAFVKLVVTATLFVVLALARG